MLCFINLKLIDIIDIVLVAILLFELYNLLKGTVAINIFFGIVAFYFLWKLVNVLQMKLLSEIFGAFISVGFIALIVVFQPEIRKFLLMLGNPGFIQKKRKRFFFWRINMNPQEALDADKVIMACRNMSENRTGALIIIAKISGLEQYVETGEKLDAALSESLIETVFFKNNPLHDGALIIQNNRIVAARCILPVSGNQRIPGHYGLRHRAAVGLTEMSDAIAIIVSEENGEISYSKNGNLQPKVKPNQLKTYLAEDLG
ncbi:MAG: TIGR00159 family protein [Bacteroidetes bacterium]|nr:TIGR00159 family protein [Bacteroidota bacterium]